MKVFHGERKVHEIRVSILDKIKVIIDELTKREPEKMKKYYSSRLVMPMGRLINLSECLDQTFIDLQIGHDTKMVYVG